MFMSVDLPDPDGPMMATNSPGRTCSGDAAQRAHLDLAHLVDASEVLDLDDGTRHEPRSLRTDGVRRRPVRPSLRPARRRGPSRGSR